ncbi:hypothetical protein BDY17DRAFT_321704 [Neohortaea acidophila]|uniref:Uncharacterized protein n=1 Tax=Neohortaea acidophila TaxID=245834 RepID=A0A6A6Q6D3_9PEZI|nr:uncharacterized protein BDY17DRAFT_321704 [Neohortaea acidophila]KAF2486957.1 hypothetical protein BDY17DRAFT_321704 [Neohortaea acidophila]
MAAATSPKGPYKLVTVNTAPERAKRLVGKMIEGLSDRYQVIHEANCSQIDEVHETVSRIQPNVLFCASMWTPEEAEQIQSLARDANPSIVTYALPQGLQVQRGPDAVVEHLIENVPRLLDSAKA